LNRCPSSKGLGSSSVDAAAAIAALAKAHGLVVHPKVVYRILCRVERSDPVFLPALHPFVWVSEGPTSHKARAVGTGRAFPVPTESVALRAADSLDEAPPRAPAHNHRLRLCGPQAEAEDIRMGNARGS